MDDPGSRRRRRRRRPPAEPPLPPPAKTAAPSEKSPRRSRSNADANRGLRDLTGAGPSQLGVSRALRARDVNRPTDDDLAEADAHVGIVRRNWKP